jgi:ABC-type branched-subunit amino acid transport system substrate-binding protein
LFVIAAPADLEATVMVDYAVDVLKAKSIAWLGDNGALSKTMHKAIQARAEKRQVNLVGAEEYPYRGDDVLPQVLKIRRANPDVLLMHPNTGEDHGLIMRTLNEAKWTVPVVNGAGSPSTPGPAVRVFPDAFKNTANLVYKSWTFCANDAVGQTPLGQFKTRLKAATGADYDKLSQNFASQAYDAIYVFKAAAEATNSVDGRTLAKWIEQNASSIKAVNSPFEASASSHFLLGSAAGTAFALDPDKPRADGLLRRVGC